jgi:hypothetical protein
MKELLMEITNRDAAELVRFILDRLEKIDAHDVIAGVEESRRLGVEEAVSEPVGLSPYGRAEIKNLGTSRRRPPTDIEMFGILFERLRQRLLVVPALARAVRDLLAARDVDWQVDTEFVSADRAGVLEASIHDLLPSGVDDVVPAYEAIRRHVSDLVPPRDP